MPKSVRYFELTWLGALALGIILSALSYSTLVPPGSELFAGIGQLFILGMMLLLILLTSRKRSNIAKWIPVVTLGLRLVLYIPQLAVLDLGFVVVLSALQLLMKCVGIYFLFTEDARAWFRKADKPETIPT